MHTIGLGCGRMVHTQHQNSSLKVKPNHHDGPLVVSLVSLGSTQFNVSFLRGECKLLMSIPQKIMFISFWEAWTLIEMERKNWEYTCSFRSFTFSILVLVSQMSHILTTHLLLVQNDDLPEKWTIFTHLCCTLIKATQLLQRETEHTAIWKQSIELRHELCVAFAVQAPCCIQKGKKWMSGQWKKGF